VGDGTTRLISAYPETAASPFERPFSCLSFWIVDVAVNRQWLYPYYVIALLALILFFFG